MNRSTAAVRIVAICLFAFLGLGWASTLWQGRHNSDTWRRDWTAFHRAGQLFADDSLDQLYGPSFATRFPFLYPPFVIYLFAPLGRAGTVAAYIVCVAAGIAALVGMLRFLRGLLPARPGEFLTITLVTLSTAAFTATLIVGQLSPLYLLILASGFWAWRHNKRLLAGALFGLMLIKPNFGLILPGLILLQRQWRMLAGFGLCAAALLLSTLPLGFDIWTDYWHASQRMAAVVQSGELPMWKQQTLYAFLCTLVGAGNLTGALRLSWLAGIAALLATVALTYRKPVPAERLPRLMAVTTLTLVACNPYAYFYDGLLLALPAIVWYVDRRSYHIALLHRACGVCIAIIYVWQHLSLFVLKGSLALVGAVTAMWLLLELADTLLRQRCEAALAAPGPALVSPIQFGK